MMVGCSLSEAALIRTTHLVITAAILGPVGCEAIDFPARSQ